MANETWKFVQAKSKQAMKQVLGIRDEKTRMKVTLPLALAPVTQEDDMRWNPITVAQQVMQVTSPTALVHPVSLRAGAKSSRIAKGGRAGRLWPQDRKGRAGRSGGEQASA